MAHLLLLPLYMSISSTRFSIVTDCYLWLLYACHQTGASKYLGKRMDLM